VWGGGYTIYETFLCVYFPQILKEEVRDLLDPSAATVGKIENGNGHAKLSVPGKPPVQIREASNGVITLAGSTEVHVSTQKEMTACLEQGSLSRATGSTNMNNQSRLATHSISLYVLFLYNGEYVLTIINDIMHITKTANDITVAGEIIHLVLFVYLYVPCVNFRL